VAEKLVRSAASRGLPISIYRPGHITGHSRTGSWNRVDFLSHLIKDSLQLGCLPDLDLNLNLTPVDYVSKAIAWLSRSSKTIGRTYHLINPEPLSLAQMVKYLRQQGYEIEVVSYQIWRERLFRMARATNGEIPHSLLWILPEDPELERATIRESLRLDAQETRDALGDSGLMCPPADGRLLDTYFAAFIRSGFLESPGGVTENSR
jgi:thioester reductase-like protein